MISMVARSTTRSNQRPDTLMQDRSPPPRRKPLATHGRTIHPGQTRSSGSLHFTAAQAPQAEFQATQYDVADRGEQKSHLEPVTTFALTPQDPVLDSSFFNKVAVA